MNAQKKYYEANKEKIKAKQHEWKEANADKVMASRKTYYETNRDAVNVRKAQKVECGCGSVVSSGNIYNHKKSITHKLWETKK